MSKKARDYTLFLEDVLSAIEKIERYTKNLTFEKLCENDMAIDATTPYYFGIDLEAVWDTIKNNLPSLKKNIMKALQSEQ